VLERPRLEQRTQELLAQGAVVGAAVVQEEVAIRAILY
jgi:hypothetical protein